MTSSFPIKGDGSEAAGAFVADLADELSRSVPVRVVAPGAGEARERWRSHLEVFRFAAPANALSTLALWKPCDLVRAIAVMRSGARMTREAVDAGPTAHVLALWALPCGHWVRTATKQNAIPYSVWTLGSDIWSLGRIPGVRSWLRKILRQADHCWSDGLRLRDDTQVIAGREVMFLPSTRRTDGRRDHPRQIKPPYRLLFLGRWHPNKGVDLLLHALATLDDSDWTRIASVHIAGGGPLDEQVRAAVGALQAQGRPIRLSGFLDHDGATAALASADRLLLPSRVESIPVVFSDAMKFDLPVIAMPVGDLPELMIPGVGTLARSVDAASYAEAIRTSLAASYDTHALHALAERFSLQNVAASLADLAPDHA